MADWFAEESFWETSFPFMFGEQKFEAASGEVEHLLDLSGVRRGTVLDLASGPGRHAVALSKSGFGVTGVDLSGFLLDKARAHATDEGVEVEWVQQSMLEFVRPDAFDLALCLYTSFGFFETDEDNRRVLANVYESLRPGGTFVLDVMGKETLAHIFEPAGVTVVPGAGTWFSRRSFSAEFTRMDNEWTFLLESGAVKQFAVRHWIYSAQELRLMLRDAGFSTIDLHGDFDGRPYDLTSRRLIAVARRPE